MEFPWTAARAAVERALAEDLGWGDVTTESLIPPDLRAEGRIVAREAGVVAGLPVVELVFATLDPQVQVEPCLDEGARIEAGAVVCRLRGPARSLLTGERTALNFLQRLSGIATLTARMVAAVQGLPVRIVDTRKTTPGLRALEKYAVRVGGGHNHRQNLSDGVLIKDNHLAALAGCGQGLAEAVRLARERAPHTLRVEVECETLDQVRAALAAGADIILLDNMPLPLLREAVRLIQGRALVEASGGITLETVRAVAETGVDLISVGALTHAARALDFSLELTFAAP